MSETAITLSVIIPVYNAENTIRETLDSVLGQSLQEIEVICVDDGSRDSSVEVIREYAARDPRVSLITQQNRYAGVARNAGMDAAKGEYLFFLDADDYVLDYALEAVCMKAEKHRLDCLKFLALTWDEKEGRFIDKPRNSGSNLRVEDFDRLLKVEKDSPLLRLGVTPWSGIYRREFVLEKNCRFNGLRCVNDRSFWNKVMTNAERIMVTRDRVTVHRVSQDQSLVGKRSAHFDCQIESAQVTEQQLREDGISAEAAELVMQQEQIDLAVWYSRFSLNPEQKAEMDRQIREYLDSGATAYGGMLQKRLEKKRPPALPAREVSPFHDSVQQPVVSVLIPASGEEESLNRVMDSLTNQTLEEMEFLFLDSGKSALCRVIMKEYASADRRFRIIDVSGATDDAQALARGLEEAKGEYIGLTDPRDFPAGDMYERLWNQAKKYKPDVVMSDYVRFRITRNGTMETQGAELFGNRNMYYRTLAPQKEKQVFSIPGSMGNGLYRKALLAETGIRRNGFTERVLSASHSVRFLRGQLYWKQAGENEAFVPDEESAGIPEKGLLPKLRRKTLTARDMILEYGPGYTMKQVRERFRSVPETHRQKKV